VWPLADGAGGSRRALSWTRHKNAVCFSNSLPSQQFQQYIERFVLSGVEETLRVLLEFLALAKAQGHLVLLALEVRWWA